MNITTHPLYRIDECPELMADAAVFDEDFNLLFLSVWGRDTAVSAFMARLTLGHDEQGLDELHIINEKQAAIPLYIHAVQRLDKALSRAYRQTLFGSICNQWIFDRRCIRPDHANGSALMILQKGTCDPMERIWALIQDTAPFALLDHWKKVVMDVLTEQDMLKPLPAAIGPLEGFRINLDVPVLTEIFGGLIRSGKLTATAESEQLVLPHAA